MIIYFLIFFIIVLVLILIQGKVKIKWRTFLKKGFSPSRGDFGIYVFDGAQGKGKTYSVVEYLLDNRHRIECFCNIKGIQNLNYTFFTGFSELIEIKNKLDDGSFKYDEEKQLVIVYDEIFSELQKGSKLSKEVLDFLCQMRKRKIIFMTTAQYWAEIPLSFRRFVRYEIQCNMFNFFGLGVLVKRFGDAENMKWDEEAQEHICPLTETTLSHCRKFIANSYDTFLRISSVAPLSDDLKKEESETPILSTKCDTAFWGEDLTSLVNFEED